MILRLLIRLFLNILSDDKCVKLYAALLICDDRNLNREKALNKAFLSKRQDLRLKLLKILNYGPN